MCYYTSVTIFEVNYGTGLFSAYKTFVNIANALQASTDTLLQGNLTFNVLVETNSLTNRIAALSPKKRNLAITQIEAILNSLEEY